MELARKMIEAFFTNPFKRLLSVTRGIIPGSILVSPVPVGRRNTRSIAEMCLTICSTIEGKGEGV
jgi:hypothetical protein